MAETNIKDFLGKDTAGLPNWAWIVVVVAGIGAAYIVPKLFGSSSSSSQTSTTGTTDSSGLGLAIDPTTGLPYAVEGLVPSGATVGGTTGGTSTGGTATPPIIQSSPPPPPNPSPPPNPPPMPPNNPTGSCKRWVVVQKWPQPQSTLSSIASANGVSLSRIIQLNPGIKNPNLVYAGQKVCIA